MAHPTTRETEVEKGERSVSTAEKRRAKKLIAIRAEAGNKLGACGKCNHLQSARKSTVQVGDAYIVDCFHRKVNGTLPQMVPSPVNCPHNPDRQVES